MIKGIKTIAQYKIMQHINNNFFSSSITTDLIADNQIKVTDSSGDSIITNGKRENLTIPAWLNTFAEANHINFSQVLQDSLTAIYQNQHA